jgi:hypothetical protein
MERVGRGRAVAFFDAGPFVARSPRQAAPSIDAFGRALLVDAALSLFERTAQRYSSAPHRITCLIDGAGQNKTSDCANGPWPATTVLRISTTPRHLRRVHEGAAACPHAHRRYEKSPWIVADRMKPRAQGDFTAPDCSVVVEGKTAASTDEEGESQIARR